MVRRRTSRRVRQQLGMPTIFNLLGPLSNPAARRFNCWAWGSPELRPVMAEALRLLGIERALVVCGEDGLDEVTLSGATRVTEVHGDRTRDFSWHPYDFGIEPAGLEAAAHRGARQTAPP